VNAKTTIRKILFITVWLCIGGGMLTLLLAAINKKNKGLCKDYSIVIKNVHNNFFIDKNDVEQLLVKTINGNIKGRPVSSFNLHELEQMLEHSSWIDDAELYFDNQDKLHVTVKEKEPVARIFTTAGNSFYIDNSGKKLPLSDKLSARVPMFTNYPDNARMTGKDSLMMNDVRGIANFILKDPFWMSQIAQIDITPDRNFELSPVIGNHLIKFGNGEDIEQKFRRLMIFYKQILSKTGFDKYKVIDVQYKGQVVALKNTDDSKGDSVLLRKNVEKLLQNAREVQDDSAARIMPPDDKYPIADEAGIEAVTIQPVVNQDNHTGSNALNHSIQKPGMKKENKPKHIENRQPKAVMPKKTGEDTNGGYIR
jgi:cell division protein FtsQ